MLVYHFCLDFFFDGSNQHLNVCLDDMPCPFCEGCPIHRTRMRFCWNVREHANYDVIERDVISDCLWNLAFRAARMYTGKFSGQPFDVAHFTMS
jgi:hypothetical protein